MEIRGSGQGVQQQPLGDQHDVRTGAVSRTDNDAVVDIFEPDKSRAAAGQQGKPKNFFARLFEAIGNFFAKIFAFFTGKSSSSEERATPASERPTVSSSNARNTAMTETLRPENSTSATRRNSNSNASAAALGTEPVASGATFGGVAIRGVDQWYQNARGTVFGGDSDPEDNGIGAFGFRTGGDGREGVAIPQRVMAELTGTNSKAVHQQYQVEVINRDTGKREVFDIVDRGPAERTWRRAGRPVLDLTEGAVRQLGGQSRKNSRGQTVRTTGIDNLSFRIVRGSADTNNDVPAAQGSGATFEALAPAGRNLGMRHMPQPDGTSCKPTTRRMIENAGGCVGRERVGNNEATRLDGDTLRRLLTQLQTSGVMTGVRSRTGPNGPNKGSSSGHVLAISGYQFVDGSGNPVSSQRVERALQAAEGDWNRVLRSLDQIGIRLRLETLDPGRGTGRLGSSSYFEVLPNGHVQRPALANDRYVSTGHLTVRYFMLD